MSKEKQQKSIKFNFVMNFIRVLMSIIFPLITYPYATRVLHKEGLGQTTYAMTIINYLLLIAAFGVNNYAITEGAKIRDDKKKLNKFATEMFTINMIFTVLAYLCFIVVLFIPEFAEYRTLLLIGSVSILFTTLGMEWLYELLEEYEYITIRSVIIQAVILVAVFVFVRSEADVAWYMALTVASAVGTGIFNFLHSRKYVHMFSERLDFRTLGVHMKPMIYMFGVSVASVIYLNSDITMLGWMKTDSDVGIYSAATKMNQVLCTLIKSLSTVIMARVAYYIEQKQTDQFHRLLNRAFGFLLMLIVPSMAGMLMLAPEIIQLVAGAEFLPAVTSERIMVINLFLSPINGFIAYQIFMPHKKEKIIFWATFGGALTNLAINYLLIPSYSYDGAAIGTVVAEAMVMCISLILGRELVDLRELIRGSWQYVIACIPMIIAYFLLVRLDYPSYLIFMFLMIMVGVFSYFLMLLILRNEIVAEEWNKLVNRFRKKEKRG